jgi:anti-sigma B factor antagonist
MGDNARLTVEVRPLPTGAAVSLVGDLDVTTASQLLGAAERAFAGHDGGDLVARDLVIDAAGLAFCDSVGISTLVQVRQRCDTYGWTFRVQDVRPYVRRVLDLLGLAEYLNTE